MSQALAGIRVIGAGVAVLLLAAAAGCASDLRPAPPAPAPAVAVPPLTRASITIEDVQRSIDDEKVFTERADRLPRPGEPWFAVLDGCTEVLATAPHATKPTRDGQLRFADSGTGSLAVALHRLAGARVIHTSLASPSDPNYYDDNEFKAALAAALAARTPVLVIDLHASHEFRPYDVDFGTMGRRSLLGRDDLLTALSAALRAEGLSNQSLDFFAAATNQTVTKWVSARGVPAIQLEISATWLGAGAGSLQAHRYAQLLQGLVRFIASLGCRGGGPR
jgi:hypothetical protein